MSVERPPLPEPRMIGGIGHYAEYWDADQMQAYARAAVNAALERAAQLVIELTEDRGTADAIRALKTNKEQGNE